MEAVSEAEPGLVPCAVFKTVEPHGKHGAGGFDSHALPPFFRQPFFDSPFSTARDRSRKLQTTREPDGLDPVNLCGRFFKPNFRDSQTVEARPPLGNWPTLALWQSACWHLSGCVDTPTALSASAGRQSWRRIRSRTSVSFR